MAELVKQVSATPADVSPACETRWRRADTSLGPVILRRERSEPRRMIGRGDAIACKRHALGPFEGRARKSALADLRIIGADLGQAEIGAAASG